MAKVKADDPNGGLAFNRYACLLLCRNRTIFALDIANSKFDHDIPFPKTHLKFNENVFEKKILKEFM